LLALRWRWMPWLHLPAALWGAWAEASGTICPLTLLENALRLAAGQAGYTTSFIEHYLLGLIYPDGLTRQAQWLLAAVVVVLNAAIYGWLVYRRTWRRNGC
ncbi:MAG TPA: DUF2784 domain-containing protein, partial [Usitatibacteraceae bacterium]|nr:DUF2784 domain-containing protein [Usitatibacteraceae bacterium]